MLTIELFSDNKEYSTKARSMSATCYVTKIKSENSDKVLELLGEGEHSTGNYDYNDRVVIKFDSVELNKIFDEAIKLGLINISKYGSLKDSKKHLIEAKRLIDLAISKTS